MRGTVTTFEVQLSEGRLVALEQHKVAVDGPGAVGEERVVSSTQQLLPPVP